MLPSCLYDNAIGVSQAVPIENPLAICLHMWQLRVAVWIAGHGVHEPSPVAPTPDRHLTSDIFAAIMVIGISIGSLQGPNQAGPPRMKKPHEWHTGILLAHFDDSEAIYLFVLRLTFT